MWWRLLDFLHVQAGISPLTISGALLLYEFIVRPMG